MKAIKLIVLLSLVFLPLVATAETQMTGAQLTQLLGEGKTLILGGSGEGYQGKLELYPDGTGKGQAITDKGKKIILEGTWKIDGDEFCRAWKGRNGGKILCERWIIIGDNKVEVRKKDKKNRNKFLVIAGTNL